MRFETISIPHEGNILGVQSIAQKSYLLIEHGSIHILTCIIEHPTWHIKLPFHVQTFTCNEQGIYLGGIRYNNAQRTHGARRHTCPKAHGVRRHTPECGEGGGGGGMCDIVFYLIIKK